MWESPAESSHLDLELAELNLSDEAEFEAMFRRSDGYRIVPRNFEILWMDDGHLNYSQKVDAALPHGMRITWARNLREARFHLGHHIDGVVVDLHLSKADVRSRRPTGLHFFEIMKQGGFRVPTAVCSYDIIAEHRKAAEALGAVAIRKLDPLGRDEERALFLMATFKPFIARRVRDSWSPEDQRELEAIRSAWKDVREHIAEVQREIVDRSLGAAAELAVAGSGRDAVSRELETLWAWLGAYHGSLALVGLREVILRHIAKSRVFDPGAYMLDDDIHAPGIKASDPSGAAYRRSGFQADVEGSFSARRPDSPYSKSALRPRPRQ